MSKSQDVGILLPSSGFKYSLSPRYYSLMSNDKAYTLIQRCTKKCFTNIPVNKTFKASKSSVGRSKKKKYESQSAIMKS